MSEHIQSQLDGVIADIMALRVFAAEVSHLLAIGSGDPEAFRQRFISRLHALLDDFERGLKSGDEFGWLEGARQRIDLLAGDMTIAAERSAKGGA